jgi:DNA-binding CsgD family transcriptional regulator
MAARHPPVLLGRASERQALDRLLENVRVGQSAVLVIRGEAGVGKTALLHHCARQASGFRVARIAGVESEMELPFAGLHQLCAPLLGRVGALPEPQQDALRVALGLASGVAPDRFLVALATLTLLAEVAAERPLLCFVDDAQWIDAASAQVLGFVARRLLAESVAVVFAVRDPTNERELASLPQLALAGLPDDDARALLATVIPGRLDERVRDRLVAETRGNPLAILELPRALAATRQPGVFWPDGADARPGRIEESFLQRLESLSEEARLLLLAAAAEPVDDPLLVWRAVERLGIGFSAAAETEGLLEIGERVMFRHPLVRSAVYRSATPQERQTVHLALAEATDPQVDPDRRAWHLAQASTAPDEPVAMELERSAAHAQARGGLGAAAAFLGRAATLSPDPSRRATRLLAAASASRDAGALDSALSLLSTVDAAALDELGHARVEMLRGQIAFDQRRAGEAARLLAGAARRLEPVAAGLARKTHLEALGAAIWVGDRDGAAGMQGIAEAALLAPPPTGAVAASDVLLDAFALLVTEGHRAAAPSLRRALELVLAPHLATDDHGHSLWFAVTGNAVTVAQELWDADAWRALALRHEQFARDSGALVHLQFALNMLAWVNVVTGELGKSALALEEDRMIAEATGNPPISYSEMVVAAWRGDERRAAELIEGFGGEATASGLSRVGSYAAYASAVLHNGLGRHAEARDAARSAFARDHAGYGPFVVPELAEAAARTGDTALLSSVLEWLTERTRVTRSRWSLGIEARVRAVMSEGEAADRAYRDAIHHLGRTRLRPELARGHLLYGEWLRREGRRADARDQLRTAHEMLAAIGMEAFADRARRELLATGEKVRKRSVDKRDELTGQERQIAALARDGLSNPEIGARLFLSSRTVEWHLGKVFTKLGITSRMGLREVLPSPDQEAAPA